MSLFYEYYSCDPMKEGNEGIWFEEEDPDSEFYMPECCTNLYVDLASGKIDDLFNDWNIHDEYEYDEYEYNEYDYDGDYEKEEESEFVEIDLNAVD